MIWALKLIIYLPPALMGLILLYLLYLEFVDKITLKQAKIALGGIILIILGRLAASGIYLYFQLKASPMGEFLLPPKSRYFYQTLWSGSSPALWSLAAALGLVLLLILLGRLFRAELVDASDRLIIILTILAVGFPSAAPLILGSLLLMLGWQIIRVIGQKKLDRTYRMRLTPFLLFLTLVIIILSNLPAGKAGFNFYQKFLDFLGLI